MNLIKPKKVAIIRGANLNKFEMQTYEPLRKHFKIEAFCIAKNNFCLDEINLPVTRLLGIEVFIPKCLKRYCNFLFDFVLEISQPMFGLRKKLRHFDIAHIPDLSYFYSYQVARAKKKYGLKLVSTHAENIPFNFGRNWFSQARIKKVIPAVDRFLALSLRAKEALVLWGIPEEKIMVVPFGINTQVFKPQPRDEALCQKYGIPPQGWVILFAGRMTRSKGVFELTYAVKKLVDDDQLGDKNIMLVFVGSGRAEKKIRELICRLGLSKNVTMIGNLEYNMMPQIHNLADVFVLPSIPIRRWQEQFGMVLIESMACAKPVISTLCGSIPEVVGDAGLLVHPADHLSLYHALKKLMLDEGLCKELGQEAQKRAEKNFSIQVVSQKLKEVYESL